MKKFLRSTWLLASAYFTLLSILMTLPLVGRMADSIVGEIGDNIYFVWLIGWTQRALFELGVNPFNVWFLNYPEGWSLAYTEITPAQILIAQPFCLLGGPVFAYNAVMMLTFILSGLGMFAWVRRLSGRTDAALIGGTIFAFLPFHFAHFRIGHLNLSSIQWFPFYFWGLCELLGLCRAGNGGAARWRTILLTGTALGLIALTSQYYLYMTLVISAVMLLLYLLFIDRGRLKDPAFWKSMLATGLAALPLILAGIAPYVLLAQEGGLPDRGIWLVRRYSASLTDFILPSTEHFLWGAWVGSHFNRELWIEGSLYIGAAAVVLAALAYVKRRQLAQEKLLKLLLLTGLAALILAMGTDLHWNEQPVVIPTPEFLRDVIHRAEIPIVLPGTLLFYYFPFYAKLRAIMRFGVFVLVFTSLAAGLGSAWLLERLKARRRGWAAAAILALVLLDFYPGYYTGFASVKPRPVDAWLAQQPGEGALAQMPFSQAEDQQHTYYTLTHHKPYIGGFFNAFPPEQYLRIRPLLEKFPDDESVNLLRQLGVQYVLADKNEYPDSARLRRQCEVLGLHYLTEIDDQMVFEMKK